MHLLLAVIVLATAAGLAFVNKNAVTNALPAGGGLSKNDVRLALRLEATNGNYNPDWFDAIAYVESDWQLDAYNGSDPSGAYGPMQMLGSTAARLGYADPTLLQKDPHIAGQAAVAYFLAANPTPNTLQDVAAYWNAGVSTFANLDPLSTTATDYWPKLQNAYSYVLSNPPT